MLEARLRFWMARNQQWKVQQKGPKKHRSITTVVCRDEKEAYTSRLWYEQG